MRSESYVNGVETLHCEPTAIRWGRKTGTCQSRCPKNYIPYFTHFWHKLCNKRDCSIVFLYNVSRWRFFLGLLCSTESILGSLSLSCQTVTCACSLHARKENSHLCMGLPWIHQQSSNLFCFFLPQYILRRSRNFGLLWIIYWVALLEDKQRQWSHGFVLSFWEIQWISGIARLVFGRVNSSFCPLRTSFLFKSLWVSCGEMVTKKTNCHKPDHLFRHRRPSTSN